VPLPKTSSALVGAGARDRPGMMAIVLLRLAYLTAANAFAMLRLLPMSDRDKDAEILALRHQITVPERQPGNRRVRSTPAIACSWRRCRTGCRRRCYAK
jgi:hypothetical protein